MDEPEPGWRPGDQILVDLPDGQTVRCRIVNIDTRAEREDGHEIKIRDLINDRGEGAP